MQFRVGGAVMIHEIYIDRGAGYEWALEIEAEDLDAAVAKLEKILKSMPPEARGGRYAVRPRGHRSHILPEGWPA